MKQIDYDILEAVRSLDPAWFTEDSTIDDVFYLLNRREIISYFIEYWRPVLTQFMIRSLFQRLYVMEERDL